MSLDRPEHGYTPDGGLPPQQGTYTSQEGTSQKDIAQEEARHVAQTAGDSAKDVAETATDAAKHAGREVKHTAEATIHEARRQAQTLLDEGKRELSHQAGTQKGRISEAFHSLAGELDQMASGEAPEDGQAIQFARRASTWLDDAAGWLDRRDPEGIANEVGRFARRNPVAFLGIAAGLGLLAGRLVRGARDDDGSDLYRDRTANPGVLPGGPGAGVQPVFGDQPRQTYPAHAPLPGESQPGQPGVDQPGPGQPVPGRPGFGQPAQTDPGFGQPGPGQPGFGQPGQQPGETPRGPVL